MLNEQQINALPNIIEQRLVAVNNIYLQMMGKRIKEIGALSATDAHRLAQMITFSDINKIIAELAEISEKNIAELYELFDAVAQENTAFSEQFYKASSKPFIPYEQNEELKKYVHALARQTAKEYSNLSQHTAFMVFKDGKKTLTSLSQTYTDIIDMAVTKTSLGLDGYQAAMRQSLRQLAQSGIRTADYATGYTRRLDTAVRQNVLWGVKTCSQGIQDITGKEFGADGYEISYHTNPRPSHVDMGGKQYTKKEYYQQGIDLLLSDYGCLHFKFSIICGVSKPNWDETQLAKMKANDNRTIEFEGKAYTGYEATQMQRKIETAIRHSKDATNLFKASGDTVGRLAEQGKLNVLVDKYSAFSKQAGLRVKKERMSVSGYRPVGGKKRLNRDNNDAIIKVLPQADKSIIPVQKFTEYALNPLKDANKSHAFHEALGYELSNAHKLIENIRDNLNKFNAVEKPDNGHGKRFEVLMELTGENNKKANVKTAWILDNKTGEMRMTSAYVTHKKTKR